MKDSFLYKIDAIEIVCVLFTLMLVCIYIGVKFARHKRVDGTHHDSNYGLITSVMALMGLLLAFTFSMSGSRFDSRKKEVGEEANSIRIAVMMADLYPDSIRTLLRQDFKNFLEARISYFESHFDRSMLKKSLEESDHYTNNLWNRVSELSRNSQYVEASRQMLPALKSMIEISNSRLFDELYKIPSAILMMLFFFILIASFLLGYTSVGKGRLDWYIAICFCLATSSVMYFILDLDRPRRGLISLEGSHGIIVSLRKMFE